MTKWDLNIKNDGWQIETLYIVLNIDLLLGNFWAPDK